MSDLFVFRKLLMGQAEDSVQAYHAAAVEKLQTLYPGKRITSYDELTIGIETDSVYSDTGIDTYILGLVDDEIPAIQNTRDSEVITFRID